MKVLIAGNSQAGPLKVAHSAGSYDPSSGIVFEFYAVPGAPGPSFDICDDRLKPIRFNTEFPPYASPAAAKETPLSAYDAIVVSALGYIDGGFSYWCDISFQAVVAEFKPHRVPETSPLVAQSCFRDVLAFGLERHEGMKFLRELSKSYSGRILVQPFPYVSDALIDHAGWHVRSRYVDVLGFNQFLNDTRDEIMQRICDETGAKMLPRPMLSAREAAFTPARFMSERDCLHPTEEYGAQVLEIIRKALSA
jgi:hypothetical protein